MAEEKTMRLNQVARKLNVGISTVVEFLGTKGFDVESKPTSKITEEQYNLLAKEFESSAQEKEEASGLKIGVKRKDEAKNETITHKEEDTQATESNDDEEEEVFIKNIPVEKSTPKTSEEELKVTENKKEEEPKAEEKNTPEEKISSDSHKLKGIKVVDKIDLDSINKPKSPKKEDKEEEVKKEEPKQEVIKEEKAPEVKAEPKAEPKMEEKPAKEETKPEVKAEKKAEPQPTGNNKKFDKPKAQQEAPKKDSKNIEKDKPAKKENEGKIEAKADQLKGLTVLGKIELPETKKKSKGKPVASSDDRKDRRKKKRKRISKDGPGGQQGQGQQQGQQQGGGGNQGQDKRGRFNKDNRRGADKGKKKPIKKEEPTEAEIQEQIKQTLAKLSGGKTNDKGKGSKYRREKRSAKAEAAERQYQQEQDEAKTLQVTEFISANDLASLMDVSVNEIISACMSLGMFVSINQRLDAETITIIADEFGYDVKFSSDEEETDVVEEEDKEEDLDHRAPIVTIMGHVDHGKTSLLDFIRSAKVTESEAGGITQHIGAYDVMTDSGKRVAFLDTPGHEAFTAMRARGAKITDVAIIVVAADDSVMPQTKEALNHAQVAGVPIVIAINKVDKPNANPDKIREELANNNILVEDWGGKYQCQEISAKTGQGIDDLLEKVLLEAELLELKANADKPAVGTVVEASLDKGRGYVTTVMVQAGTLKIGDVLLAGSHFGKVKAMFDHRGKRLDTAGPSTPVLVLGLDGAPQAGDRFNVMETDREARDIANKRSQILREQTLRTRKHITLDEIGRRLAIGSFKELNIIVKGDVDGSVEALSDSLLKLTTEEVAVNIIHKGVGQISESDVLLASASDAIVIGFQVRPSGGARRIAETEEIEIRLYSIIYDAINDVKDAMEGMLAPTVEEVITGTIEVREIFKISKVGTVAGCMVTEGFVKRNNQIRLIRDGIVVYTGDIDQLKRFKDDVGEVKKGYECGLSIKNYNDIKIGDIIEGFEEKEIKRKL
ncbi:translation initiation factor IF-2 [Marinigracilibium pacificum]|uniref:Translation initiation factor IF-2 n=1 Tax=Marinigracilibium pacificum TaxID=2729599 RepID=A0A848J1Z6_9BACT|nr:translation initiation factor IF-2 [Marinigracilibium pacificum]NMM49816.1 translation initiation factor IF-2 [Marinigracilibium pacificum]